MCRFLTYQCSVTKIRSSTRECRFHQFLITEGGGFRQFFLMIFFCVSWERFFSLSAYMTYLFYLTHFSRSVFFGRFFLCSFAPFSFSFLCSYAPFSFDLLRMQLCTFFLLLLLQLCSFFLLFLMQLCSFSGNGPASSSHPFKNVMVYR